MSNNELAEKIDELSSNLNEMYDEIYRKRDMHDRVPVDDVLDIMGSYLNDYWEEMDEIIAQLKGES